MCNDNDIDTPIVSWSELWAEVLGLSAAVTIPLLFLVFDLADRKADLFQRGGAVGLFIVVVLQFKALMDLNRKHINNALRAKRNQKIQQISAARTNLSWITLIVAIYATAISAFGDKFVHALVKALYA